MAHDQKRAEVYLLKAVMKQSGELKRREYERKKRADAEAQAHAGTASDHDALSLGGKDHERLELLSESHVHEATRIDTDQEEAADPE